MPLAHNSLQGENYANMPSTKPTSAIRYIASLLSDRKKALAAIRRVITYEVPLATYPETYNGQPLMLAALASRKNHLALYLSCAYIDKVMSQMIRKEFKKRGLKLDMGKSCIRFKSLEDIPLDLIAEVIAAVPLKAFIVIYEMGQKRRRPE